MSQGEVRRNNPFATYAYSHRSKIIGESPEDFDQSNNLTVFTGGDYQCWINNIKVNNLEQISWNTQVEVAGNYVMGDRNAKVYTTGKRVIVGSMVMSQYDKHALLEQVFNLSQRKLTHIGDLWNMSPSVGAVLAQGQGLFQATNTGSVGGLSYVDQDPRKGGDNSETSLVEQQYLTRGLSKAAFNKQLYEQLRDTARLVGAQKFNYVDQLPPFDVTLIAVDRSGTRASRAFIRGITINQETNALGQNDMGASVGMSFVALAVEPWRAITLDGGGTGTGATINLPPGL